MPSVDIEELEDDANENKRDFRRANGAPLVSDPHDPTKTLRYSRPSGYAKCLDDEEALQTWKIWKAMEGVARSKALQTQVVATRDDDKLEKKTLREKALDKGNASERADQGTGLHAMTVRSEDPTDVDFDPPEAFIPDLTAYRNALDAYGLVSEMTEVHMVNDLYRAAGTADRIWRVMYPLVAPDGTRIEPGDLIVGDLKTGKKLDFSLPGYCVQTAIYASSVLYDVVTERRLPTPPINQAWALLAHMPVGAGICEMRWCSVRLGLVGAELARDVKTWRKHWKNGTHDAPLATLPDLDMPATLTQEFDATVEGAASVAEMSAWCQSRINDIGKNPAAKAKLIQRWPEGLPTPKKGIETPDQVVTLLNLLDAIDAEFSIPFGETDPRYRGQNGHRSKLTAAPILESQAQRKE